MKAVGIVAEYNPFHYGHLYQMRKAKELSGADFVVVAMSGDYVQRGVPAMLSKYYRTKMALACGADLVLEIPVRYATADAGTYASAAMEIFQKLNHMDAISFGCEKNSLPYIGSLAKICVAHGEEINDSIKAFQKQGLSYAVAREKAIASLCKTPQTFYPHEDSASFPTGEKLSEILQSPNSILGLEYLKAKEKLSFSAKVYPVERIATGYHDTAPSSYPGLSGEGEIASATAIRKIYEESKNVQKIRELVPQEAYEEIPLLEGNCCRLLADDFSDFLFYRLLHTPFSELTDYEGITSDLAHSITNIAGQFLSFSEMADRLCSKSYTRSRINRALLHLILSVRKKEDSSTSIPFLRVLGMRKAASWLLKDTEVPVITSLAKSEKMLDEHSLSLLQEDIMASRLYNYVLESKYGPQIVPGEYQHYPVILS